MAKTLLQTQLSLLFILATSISFSQKLGFREVLEKSPDRSTTFCVPNNAQNQATLEKEHCTIKFGNESWLFITATPRWIQNHMEDQSLTDFYFEYAPPALMSDSARAVHFVNEVHQGIGGLSSSYTGAGVVVGYVDTGIDFNHEDFKNNDGSTRVLRYWDQGLGTGPAPQPYGYGTVWDSTDINNLTITSMDNSSHGTTVAGQGSGNGRANGTNKGMAPDSKIIIVESDFSLPNWTLTIADACDYIFKVADTLDAPCVINLSLGTYLGSHDGNDPASQQMEALLDEKPGRIIVAAAGNSGDEVGYHAQSNITTDTSFTWFRNNPSGAFGNNTIFFDLWSDQADATFNFGFAADLPSPNWDLRGMTNFHGATSSIGVPIYDTIWNGSNRIATIEVYTEIVYGNYHLQALFTSVDSTSYLYRFMTTGSGKYDLWSGAWLGFNDMETNIPTVGQMPAIAHYVMPDSMQSIVSSWNCSEKVVSVANMGNRTGYPTCDMNFYYPNPVPVPGQLEISSSIGPSRHNVVKPDITAAGGLSLGPAPMWMVTNPGYCPFLDSGGFHIRNGGTSMAAPVISGIAALYMEKCGRPTYNDFLQDLTSTAYTDGYTGVVPNNAYGYGKAHALDLMLALEINPSIVGDTGLCSDPIDLSINLPGATLDSVYWSNGPTTAVNTISTPGDYSAHVIDVRGCEAYTDTHTVVQFIVPTIQPIVQNGDVLSTTASDDYQWTLNGSDIVGETNSSLTITPPYGTYTCYTTSVDGCVAETDSVVITVGLMDLSSPDFELYPNPVMDEFTLNTSLKIENVELVTMDGRRVKLEAINGNKFSLNGFAKGTYTLIISTTSGVYHTKLSRM